MCKQKKIILFNFVTSGERLLNKSLMIMMQNSLININILHLHCVITQVYKKKENLSMYDILH